MPGEHIGPDAAERVASLAATHGSHARLAAVGIGAAVLRLATRSGPVRPWRAVALDCAIQTMVGFAAAEAVYGWRTRHTSLSARGVASGLIGWETLKRIAAARPRQGGVMAENQRAPPGAIPRPTSRRWHRRSAGAGCCATPSSRRSPSSRPCRRLGGPRSCCWRLPASRKRVHGAPAGPRRPCHGPVAIRAARRSGRRAAPRATAAHAAAACRRRQIPAAADGPGGAGRDDVLAAIFARALVADRPARLPSGQTRAIAAYPPALEARWQAVLGGGVGSVADGGGGHSTLTAPDDSRKPARGDPRRASRFWAGRSTRRADAMADAKLFSIARFAVFKIGVSAVSNALAVEDPWTARIWAVQGASGVEIRLTHRVATGL